MSTAIITVEDYLDLALGALPLSELSAVMRTARRSITTKATARDLGWLTCRGYGYDRAASLNPFIAGPMAAAYDAGIAAYEIECPCDFDSDDYSDISDISDTAADDPVATTDTVPACVVRAVRSRFSIPNMRGALHGLAVGAATALAFTFVLAATIAGVRTVPAIRQSLPCVSEQASAERRLSRRSRDLKLRGWSRRRGASSGHRCSE